MNPLISMDVWGLLTIRTTLKVFSASLGYELLLQMLILLVLVRNMSLSCLIWLIKMSGLCSQAWRSDVFLLFFFPF